MYTLDLPPHLRDVLLVLADHAHADGSEARPGVERIAWMLGKKPRAVQAALRKLEDPDGCGAKTCPEAFIHPVRYRGGGHGKATEYFVRVPVQAPRKPPLKPDQRGLFQAPDRTLSGPEQEQLRVQPDDKKGAVHRTPTKIEPPKPPGANAPGSKRATRQDLAFVALAESTGFDYRELTPAARSELNSALRDIRQAASELNGELPAEIRVRAGRYAAAHPKWDLTPSALAKWWPTLTQDRPPARGRDRAREIVERAFDKAARARGGGDGPGDGRDDSVDRGGDRAPAGVLPE